MKARYTVLLTILGIFLASTPSAQPVSAVRKTGEGVETATRAAEAATGQVMREVEAAVSAATARSAAAAEATQQAAYAEQLAYTMSPSPEKALLNRHDAYSLERSQVNRMLGKIQNLHTLAISPAAQYAVWSDLSEIIVNESLLNYTMEDVLNKDFKGLLRDVADYYGLSTQFIASFDLRFVLPQNTREVFVHTTLDYIKRHPHKITLKLREIMKDPMLPAELRESLQMFINLGEITPEKEMPFTTLLREAHKQHEMALAAARTSENVRATVDLYETTRSDLQLFVQKRQRAPRWNGPMPERQLFNRVVLLMNHNQVNFFRSVTSSVAGIQAILDEYPVHILSAEETLERTDKFLAKNGRLPQDAVANPGATEAELQLNHAINHWAFEDKQFLGALDILKQKYELTPVELD